MAPRTTRPGKRRRNGGITGLYRSERERGVREVGAPCRRSPVGPRNRLGRVQGESRRSTPPQWVAGIALIRARRPRWPTWPTHLPGREPRKPLVRGQGCKDARMHATPRPRVSFPVRLILSALVPVAPASSRCLLLHWLEAGATRPGGSCFLGTGILPVFPASHRQDAGATRERPDTTNRTASSVPPDGRGSRSRRVAKCFCQGRGRGEPVGRLLRQAPHAGRGKGRWEPRHEVRRRGRRVVQDSLDYLRPRARERRAAGEQFVQDRPQARTRPPPVRRLRCRPSTCSGGMYPAVPSDLPGGRQRPPARGQPGHPEVGDLGLAGRRSAGRSPASGRGGRPRGRGRARPPRPGPRPRPAAQPGGCGRPADRGGEGPAADPLGHQVRPPADRPRGRRTGRCSGGPAGRGSPPPGGTGRSASGVAAASATNFTATGRPVASSVARNTTPMPPRRDELQRPDTPAGRGQTSRRRPPARRAAAPGGTVVDGGMHREHGRAGRRTRGNRRSVLGRVRPSRPAAARSITSP